MDITTNQIKRKWELPGDPTKYQLHYPPVRAPRTTQQWDNWLMSMMLDTRLTSKDRVVLTALASHYNLKTGACFPALWRLAIEAGLGGGNKETGTRAVRATLEKAQKLGWIERTFRNGGSAKKHQTNLYELRLPEEIINHRNIGLRAVERDGAWHVAQVKDVIAICGPFKSLENAERWIEDHGPGSDRPADIGGATGGNGGTDRRNSTPITGKLQNREVIEHSVSKDTASFAPRPDGVNRFDSDEVKKGAIEKGLPRKTTYDLGDVETVRDMISCYGHNLNGYQAMLIGGLVECARQHKQELDGGVLRAMANDGHFGINRKDQLYVLETEE